VNNAGIHLKEQLVSMEIEALRSVIETHVTAAVALTQLVVPAMENARGGAVIFMGSMTSFIGMPNVVAYSAAKAAVGGVVRSLAVELAAAGIRVNGIAPGWIESPMLRQALAGDTERESRILARTPMHRFGAGEDIGRAVVYLASDAGRFVNGVMLPVDGGALIGF
jgi:gluconate 5-dehydrogenase